MYVGGAACCACLRDLAEYVVTDAVVMRASLRRPAVRSGSAFDRQGLRRARAQGRELCFLDLSPGGTAHAPDGEDGSRVPRRS